MVKLQLKLKERLPRKEIFQLVARAEEFAVGSVKPLFPDSSDQELRRFYVIEAADEHTAKKAMAALRKLKGVEFVAKPGSRTMK